MSSGGMWLVELKSERLLSALGGRGREAGWEAGTEPGLGVDERGQTKGQRGQTHQRRHEQRSHPVTLETDAPYICPGKSRHRHQWS